MVMLDIVFFSVILTKPTVPDEVRHIIIIYRPVILSHDPVQGLFDTKVTHRERTMCLADHSLAEFTRYHTSFRVSSILSILFYLSILSTFSVTLLVFNNINYNSNKFCYNFYIICISTFTERGDR